MGVAWVAWVWQDYIPCRENFSKVLGPFYSKVVVCKIERYQCPTDVFLRKKRGKRHTL